MKAPKLYMNLIPKTTWYWNLRKILSPGEWEIIKKATFKHAGYKCEICGDVGTNQGYKWPVECHEIFEYDEVNQVQILKDTICLCPLCHSAKHMGYARVSGNEAVAEAHLAKVNGWTEAETKQYIADEFKIWETRSKIKWRIDFSGLYSILRRK